METLLLTTDRDPRKDRRVAELVRMAAGVGAWKKLRVDIFFRGPAVLALDEFPEELTDGNLIQEYLPAVKNHGGEIYVEKGNPHLKEIQSPFQLGELNQSDSMRVLEGAKYSINL